MRVCRRRKAITIELDDTDCQALMAIVTDRNALPCVLGRPQKHVWRAQIVHVTSDCCGTMELTRCTGTSKTAVWRWQRRFVVEGVLSLLHDKTRPSRIPLLGTEVEARVVTVTQAAAPGETTNWLRVLVVSFLKYRRIE